MIGKLKTFLDWLNPPVYTKADMDWMRQHWCLIGYDMGAKSLDSKIAENNRLRAALQDIVNLGGAYGSAEYARQADAIARAALKETSGG